MPDTLHPPYNIVTPRTLQRWLDVNSENGSLGRVRGFINVPNIWNDLGHGNIPFTGNNNKILQYNYTNPSGGMFSFVNDTLYKNFTNFFSSVLCVCVVNIANPKLLPLSNVTRYRLTPFVKDNLPAIQYTGQAIDSTVFQIEFWTIASIHVNQEFDSAFVLNTSRKGNVDYRYGVDYNLTQPQIPILNFQNTNPNAPSLFNLPLTFNPNNTNGVLNNP